jgi:Fe-S-cluster containining protein
MPNCGGCTACCNVLLIQDIHKPVNTACPNCTKDGCSIYSNKPQTCNEFECAYLHGKNVPESLRPDNCGVIFVKRSDTRFDGVVIPNAEVTDMAKAQVESFKRQGYEVNFGYL